MQLIIVSLIDLLQLFLVPENINATRFPKLPLHQCVIYIGNRKLNMIDSIQVDDLSFQYQLIDMHTIDCETLIAINKPSALVLAVLCDFKGKPVLEVLTRILAGLEQLTGDDEYNTPLVNTLLR